MLVFPVRAPVQTLRPVRGTVARVVRLVPPLEFLCVIQPRELTLNGMGESRLPPWHEAFPALAERQTRGAHTYAGRPMSTYELELDDRSAAGVVVASLSGELDLTNARELEERLEAAAPPDTLLVVDLNRVVFIDSAALHVLFKLALERGRERVSLVVEPTAPIVRTLDIVGMKDAVRLAHSLPELGLGSSA